MDIGSAIRRASVANGLTATQVANLAGVSESTVAKWFTAGNIPNGRALLLLEHRLPGFRDLLDAEYVRFTSEAA
jgi:transcriptional regulator with XRE-family HTH domain